jgi:signal peptidase I
MLMTNDIPARSSSALSVILRSIRETGETILLALVIFLAIRAVVQNFRVEGVSMEPNLHPGTYLLVNKAIYFALSGQMTHLLPGAPTDDPHFVFHAPMRGEVVVFRFPNDPQRDFIKRVVGLPGETVAIRDGVVSINGVALRESYLTAPGHSDFGPERVPPEQYFVLGDNRANSSDSRVWGMVPRDNIVGKAWVLYYPLEDLGWAPNVALEVSAGQ